MPNTTASTLGPQGNCLDWHVRAFDRHDAHMQPCYTMFHMTPQRPLKAFRIDDELEQGLQEVWERDGITVSEQIRRAVRTWLETKGVIKPAARRISPRRKS
jgi:hypothetical protein